DDFGIHTLRREVLRRVATDVGHVRNADQGHVAPGADSARLANWQRIGLLRYVATCRTNFAVAEIDDGIIVANGRGEQAFGSVRVGRRHALESWNVREHRVHAAGVLRRGTATVLRIHRYHADGGLDDERHLYLAAEHVAQEGSLVHHRVERDANEIDEHQFG